ncbi:MAG: fibronectin type III domain-containing protein [Thermoplasmata archaeon]
MREWGAPGRRRLLAVLTILLISSVLGSVQLLPAPIGPAGFNQITGIASEAAAIVHSHTFSQNKATGITSSGIDVPMGSLLYVAFDTNTPSATWSIASTPTETFAPEQSKNESTLSQTIVEVAKNAVGNTALTVTASSSAGSVKETLEVLDVVSTTSSPIDAVGTGHTTSSADISDNVTTVTAKDLVIFSFNQYKATNGWSTFTATGSATILDQGHATSSSTSQSSATVFNTDASTGTFAIAATSNVSTATTGVTVAIKSNGGVPATPTSLAAGTVQPTRIPLTWTNPVGAVTNDTVYHGTSATGPFTGESTNGSATSYSAWGLAQDTAYYLYVTAWNSTGSSQNSSFVQATTSELPAAPTGLTFVSATTTSVSLSWTNPSGGGLVNDTVFRGASCGTYTNANSTTTAMTSFTVGLLTATTTYCWVVAAWNATGMSPISGTLTAPTLPAIEGTPVYSGRNDTNVSLAWTNPAGTATLLNVTANWQIDPTGACAGETGPTSKASLGAVSNAVVTGLNANTTYCFKVFAWDSSGKGAISNGRAVATLGPPYHLAVSTFATTTVALSWGVLTTNGTISNETVYWGTSSGGPFSAHSLASGSATSYTVTGLTSGVLYYFQVTDWSTSGQSVASSQISQVTASVPAAPSMVTVPSRAVTSITYAWTNPPGTVLNDTFYWKAGSSCTGVFTPISIGAVSTYTLTGLTSASEACAYVTAWNATGQSPDSSTVLTWTIPAAPTGMTVTGTSPSSILVAWTSPAGVVVNDYVFWELGVSCSAATMINVGFAVSSYTISGLAAVTTYCAYVEALSTGGPSAASSTATGMTQGSETPPTNLNAGLPTPSSIFLVWSNPSGQVVTNVTVFYGITCGSLGSTISTHGSVTQWNVTGLAAGTFYCFAVRAWNLTIGSNQSATASATTTVSTSGGGGGTGNGGVGGGPGGVIGRLTSGGPALVELVVAIGIIGVVTGVIAYTVARKGGSRG